MRTCEVDFEKIASLSEVRPLRCQIAYGCQIYYVDHWMRTCEVDFEKTASLSEVRPLLCQIAYGCQIYNVDH